jgi:hypothetical protein
MFKIVIIGAGKMAQEYVKVLKDINSVLIVGVVSKTLESAEIFAERNEIKNFTAINSLTTFLEEVRPSHIILCVTPDKMFPILKQLSENSYSVLVEKPIGLNFEESLEINNLSKKGNLKIYPALNRRFLPAIFIAKQIFQDIGLDDKSHPKTICVVDQQDTIEAQEYGHSRVILENWHFANGIHMLDLAFSFCNGRILKLDTDRVEFSNDKFIINAEIEFSSGDKIFYSSFWNLSKKWEITILGSDIKLLLSPIEILKLIEKNGKDISKSLSFDKWNYCKEPEEFKPGLANMVKWFLGLENFSLRPEDLLNQSHQSMEVLNKIYGGK